MLIRNLREFRKFDKSYVKITNISKKLITELNIEKLKEPLFGIIYIDYENGIIGLDKLVEMPFSTIGQVYDIFKDNLNVLSFVWFNCSTHFYHLKQLIGLQLAYNLNVI